MNRFFAALLVAGVAACPLVASADEMKSAATTSPMLVCHAAKSGETSNAMTTSKTALVCADIDMKKMMAGPDMSNVKTSKEADTAWKDFLAHQFDVR
jgi:hypothetical protein